MESESGLKDKEEKGCTKAQASMEMLVTVGFVLVFTIPVLLLLLVASQYGTENSAVYQAQASSHVLADAINEVFIQGDGASRRMLLNLPGSTREISITESGEVVVKISTSAGDYEAVSPVFADVQVRRPLLDEGHSKGLVSLVIRNKNNVVLVDSNG